MTDGFDVALDRARAAYARGLAGRPTDRGEASEALGLWHWMLARPPRLTTVEVRLVEKPQVAHTTRKYRTIGKARRRFTS